jgi:hypothetical protein
MLLTAGTTNEIIFWENNGKKVTAVFATTQKPGTLERSRELTAQAMAFG